jgi:hypothetical protein
LLWNTHQLKIQMMIEEEEKKVKTNHHFEFIQLIRLVACSGGVLQPTM